MTPSRFHSGARAVLPLHRHPEDIAVDEGSPYHQAARVVGKPGYFGDLSRGLSGNGAQTGLRVTGLWVGNGAANGGCLD